MAVSRKIIFPLDKRPLICDIRDMKSKKIDPRIILLQKYIYQTGASVREIATAIGTTDSTIYCWLKGRKVSRLASGPLNAFLVNAQMIEAKKTDLQVIINRREAEAHRQAVIAFKKDRPDTLATSPGTRPRGTGK